MKTYDVVIVGAGPAGMWCAEKLADSGLSVLLLEKNNEPGHKICAGGITRKGILMLNIPDEIVEQKINRFTLHSRYFQNTREWPEYITYTVDRLVFGRWQLNRLQHTAVEFRNNAKVTAIKQNSVVINGEEEIGYRFLVGADGPTSIVRKHLKLPVKKILTTIQYIIPKKTVESRMEIFLDGKHFHSWYAWLFPHKHSIAVGACCHTSRMTGKEFKQNFHRWLSIKGINISDATYQSYPINYDYRGLKFGNIFLAGEAAGMASGLTGEGIYQSLVSGEVVARMITGDNAYQEQLKDILKYNTYQHRFLRVSQNAGFFRDVMYDIIILLMRTKWVNRKITEGFS